MKNRDKAILSDLKRFRCMSRDDIIDLHFNGLKNAVTCCNTVMKRLRRDGQVDANITQQPFIYFPQPSTLRKTSQKIPHFLGIVDVYKQLIHYENRNYLKLNRNTVKNSWNQMHLQYGVDLHSSLKFKSQFTARRLCKIKSTGMSCTSTVRNGTMNPGNRKVLSSFHRF